jgi:branched-chain amino acid transport system permease protein
VLSSRARSGTLGPSLLVVAVVGLLGLLPIGPTLQYVCAIAMGWAIAVIGLDVFFGYVGQASFGQAGFVAIGAYTATILRARAGLATIIAVVIAVLVTAAVAGLLGVVIVRLRHFGFVVSTFFFSFVVTATLAGNELARYTGSENGLFVPPLEVFGFSLSDGPGLYYMSWAVLALVTFITANLVSGRWGRAARLVKRSEVVASVLGVHVNVLKVTGFMYAGALAGLAGFLISLGIGALTPETFNASQNIYLFGMLIVGGLGSVAGAILGAYFFTLIPQFIIHTGALNSILFALAMLVALIALPEGVYGLLERALGVANRRLRRAGRKLQPSEPVPDVPDGQVRAARKPSRQTVDKAPSTTPAVEVRGATVKFGGLRALGDVDMVVRRGLIHAVVGPNGAGKTTLLNCVSGIQPLTSGEIFIAGTSTRGLKSAAVRNLGLARTFQSPALVFDLTAIENVKLGLYAEDRWSMARDALGPIATRAREAAANDRAASMLRAVGIEPQRHGVLARHLTLGEQKLVDLARAVVAGASIVMLDEPTAGLNADEMKVVERLLLELRQSLGLSVILVSHSIRFVLAVANSVTVLDFGSVIAEGTPGEIAKDPLVITAFTGAVAST